MKSKSDSTHASKYFSDFVNKNIHFESEILLAVTDK